MKREDLRPISIGAQYFDRLREDDCFYIDKTDFIRQWWDSMDAVTLITRPRRFGKTLNMSMMNCFFSTAYRGRGDLFEGLSIWEEERFRQLQGKYPCIFITFAGVKSGNLKGIRDGIIAGINEAYHAHAWLKNAELLSDSEKNEYDVLNRYLLDPSPDKEIDISAVTQSLKRLCKYLSDYFGRKVLIFLDEYDTPLQEAWLGGCWNEIISFIRELFNNTFKTNEYLGRALLTGITRISKESIFSDLNNLRVVTTTSGEYAEAFGFTEGEVFAALDERGLESCRESVKLWYDGFVFGACRDIYNPWSITSFLKEGELKPFWANTSSNGLVSNLIRVGNAQIKTDMETLLSGGPIRRRIDEEIVFSQLEDNEDAIWSLLAAAGYLKIDAKYRSPGEGMEQGEDEYVLSLTNYEVKRMFRKLIRGWFGDSSARYNDFIRALRMDDVKHMNRFMNKMTMRLFSYFDTGTHPSEAEPERFYHGFVLGLIADSDLDYVVTSNRESGFGRYDVVMEPRKADEKAYVFEFKVRDPDDEKSPEETVQAAHRQMEEKRYDEDLLAKGIPGERIRHYGFAFEGRQVLIG